MHTIESPGIESPGVEPRWFRIVSFGGRIGPVRRTARDAWEAWMRACMRHGLPESEIDTEIARTSARLCAGTTRRAVLDSDISVVGSEVGRGCWWQIAPRVTEIPSAQKIEP